MTTGHWNPLMLGPALAVIMLVVAIGVGMNQRAKSPGPFEQRTFPCQEDEALLYAPQFGPDRVGCINTEEIAP